MRVCGYKLFKFCKFHSQGMWLYIALSIIGHLIPIAMLLYLMSISDNYEPPIDFQSNHQMRGIRNDDGQFVPYVQQQGQPSDQVGQFKNGISYLTSKVKLVSMCTSITICILWTITFKLSKLF